MPVHTDMATNDLLQRCLEAGELSPSRVHHTSMCNAHTQEAFLNTFDLIHKVRQCYPGG